MNAKDEFRSNWTKFMAKLKGRLLGMSKNGELTFQAVSEIFDSEREFWLSHYEEGGRWIERFSEQDTTRGDIIRKILANDLHFSKSVKPKSNIAMLRILRIAIGVVVGLLLIRLSPDSWIMKSETLQNLRGWVPYLSAGCGGVIFYFLGLSFDASLVDKGMRKLTNGYLHQLDKFKLSVEAVLSDGE